MRRVIGIGGIFFKAKDPRALGEWYRQHLGFDVQPWGGAFFHWGSPPGAAGQSPDPGPNGYTVWSPFSDDTQYFEPSQKPFMLNLRVQDVDVLLADLRAAGVQVLDRREETEQGKFGYVVDPEGTLLELWQPSADDPSLKES
jgi:catechol 2,3-dioxygenase-like lactoylglutathione lyase family enzyme